jgi:hypothetical protein
MPMQALCLAKPQAFESKDSKLFRLVTRKLGTIARTGLPALGVLS